MTNSGLGFGEALRLEREHRGVSLDRLSAETKVNLRHFRALEEGDYKVLPGGVFRRGIVRAYLRSVGLDEQEWMARFQASHAEALVGESVDEEAWATFADNVRRGRSRKRESRRGRWLGVLALLLAVAAAAWALWFYFLRFRVQS